MRKPSRWNTLRYHLGEIGRCISNCFHGWQDRDLVAPAPRRVSPPQMLSVSPVMKAAIPMPYAPGAGPVVDNGERAEVWITGTSDEATAEAFLAHIGIRWQEAQPCK